MRFKKITGIIASIALMLSVLSLQSFSTPVNGATTVSESATADTVNKTGDVNFDGELTVADVVEMQKYLHNMSKYSKENFSASDINQDNCVNVIDLALLKRKMFSEYSIDIAFVFDCSGSMSDNDPNNIRQKVAIKFIEKLHEEDSATIITFTDSATTLVPLTKMNAVDENGVSGRNVLLSSVDGISTSNGCSSGTNGSAGIRNALDELNKSTAAYKYVIFLTDGDDTSYLSDYESEDAAYTALENEARDNIVIHTIGLIGTGNVDVDILREIAENTGGKYYLATTTTTDTGTGTISEEMLQLDAIYEELENVIINNRFNVESITTPVEESKRNIIDIFMKNYDEWEKSVTTTIGYCAVGFLDLDFDGTLELVISKYGGRQQGDYFEFYQIKGNEIAQMYSEPNNNSMFPNDKLSLYQDKDNNKIYYGNYINGDVLNSSSFTYDVSQNMIVQELYSTTIDELTTELKNLNLTYKFNDIRNLESIDEIRNALQESYDAFSYDGFNSIFQSETEPTPEPQPEPEPIPQTNLEIQPDVHYYGSEVVNGITLNYDLYLHSNGRTFYVTTPTEIGGTIDYTFDNFDFLDGVYTYHDGVESEFVPGATRSLVTARDLSGTIRVVDNDTIEWNVTGGNVGRTFTIIMTK